MVTTILRPTLLEIYRHTSVGQKRSGNKGLPKLDDFQPHCTLFSQRESQTQLRHPQQQQPWRHAIKVYNVNKLLSFYERVGLLRCIKAREMYYILGWNVSVQLILNPKSALPCWYNNVKREKQNGGKGIVMQSHQSSASGWNVRKKPLSLSPCKYAHSTIHLAHSAPPKDIISGIWEKKPIHNKHSQELLCLQLGPLDILTERSRKCARRSTCWAYCVHSPLLRQW